MNAINYIPLGLCHFAIGPVTQNAVRLLVEIRKTTCARVPSIINDDINTAECRNGVFHDFSAVFDGIEIGNSNAPERLDLVHDLLLSWYTYDLRPWDVCSTFSAAEIEWPSPVTELPRSFTTWQH